MKSKIALIHRSSKNKRFSIETLFSSIDEFKIIERVELPIELNSISSLFRLFFFSFKIKQKIIHITGDVHFMTIFLFWKKNIITIHDLNYFESLSGIKKFIYGLIWFKLPLIIADKIVAISPYTKFQIQKYFKINDNKIIVIPNSFKKFESQLSAVTNQKNEFKILCIGNAENKNIERLIYAIEGINNISLNLIGKQPIQIIKLLETKKIKFSEKSNLTRDELEFEYISSNVLFFASIKEGFGLPILEAQSIGLPVITSNTTSMPFVAGDGAILVDPYSIESIKESILLIIDDNRIVDLLKEKGFKNIERFLESNFLESYMNLYKSFSK
jgi:glycosyltransferase involved in cell wall biosynthesis